MISKTLWQLGAIICAVIIGWLSLVPPTTLSQWTWSDLLSMDKLAHSTAYFVLMILAYLGFSERIEKNKLLSIAILASYGILLEVLQNQMYLGRRFEFLDIIANISGLILGLYLIKKIVK